MGMNNLKSNKKVKFLKGLSPKDPNRGHKSKMKQPNISKDYSGNSDTNSLSKFFGK